MTKTIVMNWKKTYQS